MGGAPAFNKVLVANRGEIALRVIRACRELGLPTVAIYSECDANALHVRFADEAVCIGPPEASRSYLHIPSVLSAADITGADAIHPGYGFLAENADFAKAVHHLGLTFVGPDPELLMLFGDKLSAKAAARRAGLPLVPGSDGPVTELEEVRAAAEVVGYPIIIKASGGGGGKGMRLVEREEDLETAFNLARIEAGAAFGNPEVFVERFLRNPRHVEVQVASDRDNNAIHLFERDCSMQRRHQKVLEEAPAPGLEPDLRQAILEAARALVANTDYHTVGTCEFLVEGDEFFFLEVNPRIQVEHPITEEITGVDLVRLQLHLAAGLPMPVQQDRIRTRGHAIEIRINAEHPFRFTPSPGRITGFNLPGGPGVRVDSAVHENAMVQPFYDSLIAKLIVHAPNRDQAIARMERALHECVIEGIDTTLDLHRELVASEAFRGVRLSTRFIDSWLEERGTDLRQPEG